MEAACRWFLQEAAAIPRLFPGEERDKRQAGRIRTQSLEEQPQKARTERRRGLTLLVPQELRLGTPCSWDLGIRRKGTAQLVMVPLKGPVISEQNLDPGPTVSATHCYCWDWGTCWVTFGANKWEEKSLCLGSKSVDRMQQTSGWQRWSEVLRVPDSVWWSRVWRVCLELRGKSWKTSTTCSVLWSLTYFWSPWLLTSRFASCLLSCLHASTWYVIPFMLLWSLGFSPWLGFAFIGTFLGVSQKRPTWPSLSFRPLLNNITRKEKSPLGAIKTRMPCCWCFSSISGLSFLDHLANSFPCLADVLA